MNKERYKTMKRILFQGDSITDAGRDRDNIYSAGAGYARLVSAKMGFDHPGEYEFLNLRPTGSRGNNAARVQWTVQ